MLFSYNCKQKLNLSRSQFIKIPTKKPIKADDKDEIIKVVGERGNVITTDAKIKYFNEKTVVNIMKPKINTANLYKIRSGRRPINKPHSAKIDISYTKAALRAHPKDGDGIKSTSERDKTKVITTIS